MRNGSVTGLPKETAAALSYVFGFFSGFLMLLLEKDDFVRFHALQSVVFSISMFVVNTLLRVSIIFSPLVPLFYALEFVVWLISIYQASQGVRWSIPVLGKIVSKVYKAA